MSLINEALKRARQLPAAPAPDLHYRPVEPAAATRHTSGMWLPIVLAAVALLALVAVWQIAHRSNSPDQKLALAPAVEPNQAASTESPTTPVPAPPAKPMMAPATQSTPAPAPALANAATTEPVAPSTTVAATNAAPAVEPAAPPPPPLKLQGVVYNPRRPSAVISGRTLFIGDRIRDFRVVAIGQDSATLVGAGQTNLLSLSE